MSHPHISLSLRQRVAAWANYRCSYCQTQAHIIGSALEIDHIIPLAAGGATDEANLCLSCSNCNQAKGAKTKAIDSVSGQSHALFNPRTENWHDHFRWSDDDSHIIGITPAGRATVSALDMNRDLIVKARRRWKAVGWHPPS